MEIIQRLQASAKLVLMQLELHGRLANIEWQQEKKRLQQWALYGVFSIVFVFCALFFAGFVVLALSWATPYRWQAITALVIFYGAGALFCYLRCQYYAAQGASAFAATRAELAADIALIRSQL